MPDKKNKDLEQRLQLAALEAAEDGVIITDSSGKILWVNPKLTRMCGYSRDELIGGKPSLLKSGRHDNEFYRHLWETILSGQVWRSELYNRRKDGTIYPEEESITPILDAAGEVSHFVAIKRDISVRKRQEHQQQRTSKALRALSSVNMALVQIKDEDELLDEVCRVITEVAGYRLAWVGYAEHDQEKSIRPVAQHGFDEGYLQGVNLTWSETERGRGPGGTAVRSGKPCVILDILNDVRFRPWREQARVRGYESVVGLPLRDNSNTFGVLLIYSAFSEAFDTEELELLRELADDLAFGIKAIRAHQERHLMQRQLQQAQKMEAIGHLTSGIAHDFNNMLASILGYTELTMEELEGIPAGLSASYLQQIYHAGDKARKLIAQLQSFSRSDVSQFAPTELPGIIKATLGILGPILPAAIDLSSYIEAGLPAVQADQVQMQQVIMNLCINARDAMPKGGELEIGVRRANPGATPCSACHQHFSGEMLELYVSDSGCGIETEILEKIFDPFFTTKAVGKGTGMGLASVQGIVHEHGGHLLVESTPGKGSCFRIFLPPTQQRSLEPPQPLPRGELLQYKLSGRLLIVDDSLSVAALIGELLKGCGCEVEIAGESELALRNYCAIPDAYDLVIMDQRMPGITGNELAEAMLRLRKELPIIIYSASSSEEEKQQARALGVRAYLDKPIDSQVLIAKVAELLPGSHIA